MSEAPPAGARAGLATREGSPPRPRAAQARGRSRAPGRARRAPQPRSGGDEQRPSQRDGLKRRNRMRLEIAQQDDHIDLRKSPRHLCPVIRGDGADLDRVGDPEICGETPQLGFVGSRAANPQSCPRLRIEHMRERRNHAVVALVALEPPDRGDQWVPERRRAARLRRRAGCGKVNAVGDQREALRRDLKLRRVLLDLKRRERDQRNRSGQQRAQQRTLPTTGLVADRLRVPATVERHDIRNTATCGSGHRKRGNQRVVGLHVDHVPVTARDLGRKLWREHPVASARIRADAPDLHLTVALDSHACVADRREHAHLRLPAVGYPRGHLVDVALHPADLRQVSRRHHQHLQRALARWSRRPVLRRRRRHGVSGSEAGAAAGAGVCP